MRPGADNLGTVRDLAEYNAGTDTTTIVNHITYDAFGNVINETAAVDHLFGYTGRAFDEEIGLQNNLNRWYDPAVGRWLSEDPIGFEAGDANVYRYVGNFATGAVDPDGLNAIVNFWNNGVTPFAEGLGSTLLGTLQEAMDGASGKKLIDGLTWLVTEDNKGRDLADAAKAAAELGRHAATENPANLGVYYLRCYRATQDLSPAEAKEIQDKFRKDGVIEAIIVESVIAGKASGKLAPTSNVAGISANQAATLLEKLKAIPGVKKVLVFGSRTKGTSSTASDLDVLLIGNIDTTSKAVLQAMREARRYAKEIGIGPGKQGNYLDPQVFKSLKDAKKSFKNNPLPCPEESVPKFKKL